MFLEARKIIAFAQEKEWILATNINEMLVTEASVCSSALSPPEVLARF
jgi:hypothetical protein